MSMSTEQDNMAALEEIAPRDASADGAAPVFVLRRESASNDGTYAQSATNRDRIEPWAARAVATNGWGDVATADVAYSPRSFIIGEIIVAILQAIGAVARRAYARHEQRRQATAVYDTLSGLDDRTLRDLGLYRGELKSVAADMTREAACTRVRVPATKHAACVLQYNSAFAPPEGPPCRPNKKPPGPRVPQ